MLPCVPHSTAQHGRTTPHSQRKKTRTANAQKPISDLHTVSTVQTKAVFDSMDTDKSGDLDRSEIIAAMKKMPALPGTPPIEVKTTSHERRVHCHCHRLLMQNAADAEPVRRGLHRRSVRRSPRPG